MSPTLTETGSIQNVAIRQTMEENVKCDRAATTCKKTETTISLEPEGNVAILNSFFMYQNQ